MSRGVFESPEARARVVELVRGGATMAEVAGEFGVTRKALHQASSQRLDWLAEIDQARDEGKGARALRKVTRKPRAKPEPPAEPEAPDAEPVEAEPATVTDVVEAVGVVEGELILPPPRKPGQAVDAAEYLEIASNVYRDTTHPHWAHAARQLGRLIIEPMVMRELGKLKRELEQTPTGELRQVLVLRIPLAEGGR